MSGQPAPESVARTIYSLTNSLSRVELAQVNLVSVIDNQIRSVGETIAHQISEQFQAAQHINRKLSLQLTEATQCFYPGEVIIIIHILVLYWIIKNTCI